MTALTAALSGAGIRTTADRVEAAARQAVADSGGNFERAVAALWLAIGDDAALLREVFGAQRHGPLGAIIRRVATENRNGGAEDGAAGTGGARSRLEPNEAPPRPSTRNAAAPGRRTAEDPTRHARNGGSGEGGPDEPGAQSTSASPPVLTRKQIVQLASASARARRTILDTHMTEFDRPLGDCTKADLEDLARRNKRRSWFYTALAVQLPPTGVARVYLTPEDVDALWSRSLDNQEQRP